MPNTKPPFWLGVVAAAAAVALTTLLVYPLKPVAADISRATRRRAPGVRLVKSVRGQVPEKAAAATDLPKAP